MSSNDFLLITKKDKYILTIHEEGYQREVGRYDSLEQAVKEAQEIPVEYGLHFNI